MTDGKGKTIECKNAIFVMTSNLASEEIAEHAMQLRSESERLLTQRIGNNSDEDQAPEQIVISRNFKDKVVDILNFIVHIQYTNLNADSVFILLNISYYYYRYARF